jgi:hypothetical protein
MSVKSVGAQQAIQNQPLLHQTHAIVESNSGLPMQTMMISNETSILSGDDG